MYDSLKEIKKVASIPEIVLYVFKINDFHAPFLFFNTSLLKFVN